MNPPRTHDHSNGKSFTGGRRARSNRLAAFRVVTGAVLLLTLLPWPYAAGPAYAAGPCGPPIVNSILCENTKPGNPSSEWDISGSGDSSIQGFATDISVNKGGTVNFKVSTPAASYRMDVYRLGYYQGNGARKIASVSRTSAQSQPACLMQATTGLVDCGNWAVSLNWNVPPDATSGVYIGRLVRADTGGASHVVFIVRDDSGTAPLLLQTSDTTWQAYNDYGGNSFYSGSPNGRAYKLSYNRPFSTRGAGASGAQSWLFSAEYPMIRWLEANGYNISYTSGVDTDRQNASVLKQHKVFVSVGHDEYWSAQQRANVEGARDAGLNLAFFSGNEVFWKTRWETSIDGTGTPYRTLVSYKETHANAKIDPTPTWTGTWRDPRFSPPADGGRPENSLTGTLFMVNCCNTRAIEVPAQDGKMRFWRNTSIATQAPGAIASLPDGTLGYEWDVDADNGFRPAGLVRLSDSTYTVDSYLQDNGSTFGNGTADHALTLYRAPSGALVFGAGTVQWSWGLDATHDNGTNPPDVNMQQATVNLFADMGVQPGSVQPGLVSASMSTDTVAPTSSISSPPAGATLPAGSPVTISGTAADTGGGVVGGVEVSTDGGTTWHRATGRATWTYSWTPSAVGTIAIKSRAADDSGNIETPGSGIGVVVNPNPIVTFNDLTNVGKPLQGQYPTGVIDWGSSATWLLSGPYGKFTTNSVTFNGLGVTSATFSFQLPRRLDSVTAFNGGSVSSTVSISCGGQATSTQVLTPNTLATIQTGWVGPCTNVTLTSTNGWDTNFDDITHYPATVTDKTPPVISGVSAASPSANAAQISWTTDKVSDSQVEYGASTNYGSTTALDPSLVTNHTVALNALSPSSLYHYRVASRDASGNLSRSSDATFTTPPGGTTVTITFDDKPGQDQPLVGQYPTGVIDWGASGWWQSGPFGLFTTKSASFNGSGVSSATFNFITPRPLVSLDAFNGGGGATTVSVSCSGVPTRTSSVSANTLVTIVTSWSTACTPVTLASTNGWNTNFDNLVYDVAAPVISAVSATNISASGATITWSTDKLADSQVEYGTTTAYGSTSALDATAVAAHSVTLAGLSQNTTYHYRVRSQANVGNPIYSGDVTFATLDTVPPLISGLAAGSITSSTATVTWTTDKPADSQVEYGLTTAYGTSTTLSAILATGHSQALNGLSPSTLYHARVKSKDSSGNLATSGDMSFTTLAPPDTTPPVISGLTATGITSNSATITWTTDKPSDSQVDYGTTAGYGSSTTLDTTLRTSHSVTMSGLASGLSYHYRAKSSDASANKAISSDSTFNTAPPPGDTTPPVLSALAGTRISSAGAVITWISNEGADSQVEYGTSTAYGTLTALDGSLATSHAVPLSGLTAKTAYHFRVRSKDAAGNLAISGDAVFTTTRACPCTLWDATAVPAEGSHADTGAVELGLKFQADADGFIKAIRFYKGTANSGSHVVSLWTATGARLANATATGETVSGWQQVTFSSPVAVTAGTTYIASYNAPNGGYALDQGFFASAGRDVAPLHAPATGAAGGNGTYSYGAAGTFPTSTFNGANYWVDVLYDITSADNIPPTISAVQATAITSSSATITWTTDKPSDTQVEYGTTIGYGSLSALDSARVTGHSAGLAGLTSGATYHYRVKSRDAAGNLATSDDFIFTATALACPCSLWSGAATPAIASQTDPSSVEVGVKFQSDRAGYVTALRFYKGSANTGTHIASLWNGSGTRLAYAAYTGETASGWQQVTLAAPVAVQANTTYVASYNAPVGGYALDQGYFASTGRDVAPLHAPSTGVVAGNGVFGYGAAGTFPTSSVNGDNYWVDVVFNTTAVDTQPPGFFGVQASSLSSTGATVSWTTNEPSDSQVEYGTAPTFGSSSTLDTTLTATHSVQLTGLVSSATYYYRVKSKDASGNLGTSGAFTFATPAAPACPCQIWPSTATPAVAAQADAQPIELGVKFRSDMSGFIKGIRFYKGAGNTGTHVGSLWTSAGSRLASATFVNESASGWQQVTFATPVAIAANTTYVASYFAPNGSYALTSRYFEVSGQDNSVLHAPPSATVGGNGVYAYGPSGFPSASFASSNYWVDVIFSP